MKKFIQKHVILRYKIQENRLNILTDPHYSNTITKYIILDLDHCVGDKTAHKLSNQKLRLECESVPMSQNFRLSNIQTVYFHNELL